MKSGTDAANALAVVTGLGVVIAPGATAVIVRAVNRPVLNW